MSSTPTISTHFVRLTVTMPGKSAMPWVGAGSVLFDEGFRVVALNLNGDGEKQVPIFTDEALLDAPTAFS